MMKPFFKNLKILFMMLLFLTSNFSSTFTVVKAQERPEQVLIFHSFVPLDHSISPFNENDSHLEWLYVLNTVGSSLYTNYADRANNVDEFIRSDLADGLPEVTTDGKTMLVKVKSDIKFSNGNDLTIDDILFSYYHYFAPAINPFYLETAPLMKNNITKYNDTTLKFEFKTNSIHNYKVFLSMPIFEKTESRVTNYNKCLNAIDLHDRNVYCKLQIYEGVPFVGSGPFMIENHDEKDHTVVLVRNPYYYGSPAWADRIIFASGFEDNATKAMIDGRADIINMDSIGHPILEGSNYNKTEIDHSADLFIALNMLHPIYGTGEDIPDNPTAESTNNLIQARHVRKAFSHIIARDLLVNQLGGGHKTSVHLSPASYGYNYSLEPHIRDIQLAKQELEKAGFNYNDIIDANNDGFYNGTGDTQFFSFSIIHNLPEFTDLEIPMLEAFKTSSAQIGVNVELKPLPREDKLVRTYYYPNKNLVPLYANGGFDAAIGAIVGWGIPIPMETYKESGLCTNDEDGLFSSGFGCDNFSNYVNPVLSALISAWEAETIDLTKRKELLGEIQMELHNDIPYIGITTLPSIIPIKNNLIIPDSKYGDIGIWHIEEARKTDWVRSNRTDEGNSEQPDYTEYLSLSIAIVLIAIIGYQLNRRIRKTT